MRIFGFPVVVDEEMKVHELKIVFGSVTHKIECLMEKQADGSFILKPREIEEWPKPPPLDKEQRTGDDTV